MDAAISRLEAVLAAQQMPQHDRSSDNTNGDVLGTGSLSSPVGRSAATGSVSLLQHRALGMTSTNTKDECRGDDEAHASRDNTLASALTSSAAAAGTTMSTMTTATTSKDSQSRSTMPAEVDTTTPSNHIFLATPFTSKGGPAASLLASAAAAAGTTARRGTPTTRANSINELLAKDEVLQEEAASLKVDHLSPFRQAEYHCARRVWQLRVMLKLLEYQVRCHYKNAKRKMNKNGAPETLVESEKEFSRDGHTHRCHQHSHTHGGVRSKPRGRLAAEPALRGSTTSSPAAPSRSPTPSGNSVEEEVLSGGSCGSHSSNTTSTSLVISTRSRPFREVAKLQLRCRRLQSELKDWWATLQSLCDTPEKKEGQRQERARVSSDHTRHDDAQALSIHVDRALVRCGEVLEGVSFFIAAGVGASAVPRSYASRIGFVISDDDDDDSECNQAEDIRNGNAGGGGMMRAYAVERADMEATRVIAAARAATTRREDAEFHTYLFHLERANGLLDASAHRPVEGEDNHFALDEFSETDERARLLGTGERDTEDRRLGRRGDGEAEAVVIHGEPRQHAAQRCACVDKMKRSRNICIFATVTLILVLGCALLDQSVYER